MSVNPPSPSSSTLSFTSTLQSSALRPHAAIHPKPGASGSTPASGSAPTTSGTNQPAKVPYAFPVAPSQTKRFDFAQSFSHKKLQKMLPPGRRLTQTGKRELERFIQGLDDLPDGWEQYIHLDGKPYFRNISWNAVTEVNILDSTEFQKLTDLYDVITRHPMAPRRQNDEDLKLPERFELYLCFNPKPGYYYVDHDGLEVFWPEEVPLATLGYQENTSIELWLERQYYAHLENFPVHNVVPPNVLATLKAELAYACTDHMTSREYSTAAWNTEDSKTFLELLESLEGEEADTIQGYKTWFAARLLSSILYTRIVYRYGMYDARTDRLAALSAERAKRPFSSVTRLLGNMLSFRAHRTYVERLEEAWADRIVSLDDWRRLVTSLLTEWSDSNLLSTVVLSGNLAFLAISDITDKERAASMVSVFFATGSIVTGLHHVWRHRVKADTDASHAGKYFRNATNSVPSRSLRPLGFFLSLPLILLSWSLVAFVVAMVLYAFANKRPVALYVVVGVVVAVVLGVVVVSVAFFERLFTEDEKAKGLWLQWEMFLTRIRRRKVGKNVKT